MLELKEIQEMKVGVLNEQTTKQYLNPNPAPKSAHQGPKKQKNDYKIKSNSKVKIEVSLENKSYSTT